jgi:hypothetical protein
MIELLNLLSTTQISELVRIILILDNESAEIDKRTVLDLCAHMFHPKDATMDISEAMEINDMKYEDRIKEFENEQGDLIFECFQDEIN